MYDERFKGQGFDRIQQICELYVAGFSMLLLDNAFVVHDGFKVRRALENLNRFALKNLSSFSIRKPKSLICTKWKPKSNRKLNTLLISNFYGLREGKRENEREA